jgi:Fe-S cluster biogenesis protein NfuA
MSTTGAPDFQSKLQHLDTLLRELEQLVDPAARDRTREIVQAVLDLHGTGLERILALLAEAGEPGAAVLDACAGDGVVGGLLLLHGLHPSAVEDRVLQALDQVRPYLRSHGGNVELLGVDEGIVRLRLEGSCHGCPSSAVTMKQTIEEAIFARAPDVIAVELEEQVDRPPVTADGRVPTAFPVLPIL